MPEDAHTGEDYGKIKNTAQSIVDWADSFEVMNAEQRHGRLWMRVGVPAPAWAEEVDQAYKEVVIDTGVPWNSYILIKHEPGAWDALADIARRAVFTSVATPALRKAALAAQTELK